MIVEINMLVPYSTTRYRVVPYGAYHTLPHGTIRYHMARGGGASLFGNKTLFEKMTFEKSLLEITQNTTNRQTSSFIREV